VCLNPFLSLCTCEVLTGAWASARNKQETFVENKHPARRLVKRLAARRNVSCDRSQAWSTERFPHHKKVLWTYADIEVRH